MAGHIVLATCKPEQAGDIGQVFSLSFSWISPESKRWKEGSSRRQPANHHHKVLCSEEQWQLTTFRAIHSDEEETLLQRKRFTSAQKRFLETDAFSTSKNLIFCSYSKQTKAKICISSWIQTIPFAKSRQYGKVYVGESSTQLQKLWVSLGQLLHLFSLDLSFLIPDSRFLGVPPHLLATTPWWEQSLKSSVYILQISN